MRQLQLNTPDGAFRPHREHVQALLVQLMAELRLVLGDIHAFDDFAVGRGDTAAKFHAQRMVCKDTVGIKLYQVVRTPLRVRPLKSAIGWPARTIVRIPTVRLGGHYVRGMT